MRSGSREKRGSIEERLIKKNILTFEIELRLDLLPQRLDVLARECSALFYREGLLWFEHREKKR